MEREREEKYQQVLAEKHGIEGQLRGNREECERLQGENE
jgi:hypothetical protein